jgi:hypothetical protein
LEEDYKMNLEDDEDVTTATPKEDHLYLNGGRRLSGMSRRTR